MEEDLNQITTNIQVLVQDLTAYIDTDTNKLQTVDIPFILSLFEDYAEYINQQNVEICTKNHPDGSPYTYAIITFDNYDQAVKAVSEINYTMLNGVPIRLNVLDADVRKSLLEGKGKIIIKNLSDDITLSNLDYTMSDYGEIIDCNVPTINGKSLSYGIVQFHDAEKAKQICEQLNGFYFNRQKVEIVQMDDIISKEIKDINKKWRQLLIFGGFNFNNQLYHLSNSKSEDGDDIISPPINYPIQYDALSYSVFFKHNLTIFKNEKAYAIGDNSCYQINHFAPSNFVKKSQVKLKVSRSYSLTSFESAVCGLSYTLYLCSPDDSHPNRFLAINGFTLNNGKVTILPTEDSVPYRLFGGEKTCAAIDTEGGIIIVNNGFISSSTKNQEPVFFKSLPGERRAVLLALLKKRVYALAEDGSLYVWSFKNKKANFSVVPEFDGKRFVHVAGTSCHCIAVEDSGDVYAKGENEYGQLGVDDENEVSFLKLENFSKSRIVAAFAGVDHSLFLDESGAVYACGRNQNGQLMIEGGASDVICKSPVETVVKSGATFCIAGNGLSVAFLYSKPPKNTPNMKIESFDDRSEYSDSESGNEESSKSGSDYENDDQNEDENDDQNEDENDDQNEDENDDQNEDENDGQNEDENDDQNEDANDDQKSDSDDDNKNDYHIDNSESEHENSGSENDHAADDKAQQIDRQINQYESEIKNDIKEIQGVIKSENQIIGQLLDGNHELLKTIENVTHQISNLLVPKTPHESVNSKYKNPTTPNKQTYINTAVFIEENNDDEEEEEEENEEEEEEEEFNSKNYNLKTIRFTKNSPTLKELGSVFWPIGTTKYVEFFPRKKVPVTVIDIKDVYYLQQSLDDIVDDHAIAVDFECNPDNALVKNPISVFQICTTKGVLIVLNNKSTIKERNPLLTRASRPKKKSKGLQIMEEFFSSHSFFGKGMSCESKKLEELFGKSFNIEDIQITRLKPHRLPLSFSALVKKLIGQPAAEFKDKSVSMSMSNWDKRPLSVKQVLYAAFEVYATRLFMDYFVNEYGEDEVIKTENKRKRAQRRSDSDE